MTLCRLYDRLLDLMESGMVLKQAFVSPSGYSSLDPHYHPSHASVPLTFPETNIQYIPQYTEWRRNIQSDQREPALITHTRTRTCTHAHTHAHAYTGIYMLYGQYITALHCVFSCGFVLSLSKHTSLTNSICIFSITVNISKCRHLIWVNDSITYCMQ